MTEPPAPPTPQPRRRKLVIAAGAVAVVAAIAAVYGIAGFQRNADAKVCQAALTTARRIAPLTRGQVAAISAATKPLKLPNLSFVDGSGKTRRLADWRGRTVLLNLWATWCVPCRREVPSLNVLEHKLGGPRFQVVAVNIDTRNTERPKTWLKQVGADTLAYYADPSAKVFQDLKTVGRAAGLPTNILVGPKGCEIAYMAGPADWSSPDALKLIEAAFSTGTAKPAPG